jgi:ABC-2 type transport system ATP-binding protein
VTVAVSSLTKRYGGTTALDEVSLDIGRGELHGLVGPNGAGKTTLLRALLGLVRPDAGDVRVTGTTAGFVDVPRHYPYLTGRRNLQVLRRLDGEQTHLGVDEALGTVGLSGAADTQVRGWSTGMRQRLGLAAALVRRPDVLVVDEPTSGLDPVGVAEVYAVLTDLASQGTTVVLSSHQLVDVAGLCEVVTLLGRGTVRYHGSVSELRHRHPAAVHLVRTSDDDAAAALLPDVVRTPDGLRVTAADTDPFVLALAAQGIAVRQLVEESDPLTRAFLELTA